MQMIIIDGYRLCYGQFRQSEIMKCWSLTDICESVS